MQRYVIGMQMILIISVFSIFLLIGCQISDIGNCCYDDATIAPEKKITAKEKQDWIRKDPAYTCNSFYCVSYLGRPAHCTDFCKTDADCPKDFICTGVFQSTETKTSSKSDFVGKSDKVCVENKKKASYQCKNPS